MIYCLLSNSCIASNTLEDHICCSQCKSDRCKKSREVDRCHDDPKTCKYACTKEECETHAIIHNHMTYAVSPAQPKKKKVEESIEDIMSRRKVNIETSKAQLVNATEELNDAKDSNIDFSTLTVSQLAKMTKVTYDKAAYLVRCKHLTMEAAYKELTRR